MGAGGAVQIAGRQGQLVGRIRLLVTATITWNLTEVVVALAAGVAAGSPALVGFGLDSVVEVASAATLAWQFAAGDPVLRQARERAAMRGIGLSFLALACWIGLEAGHALAGGEQPRPSVPGLALAGASVFVMPALSCAQRRTGRALDSLSAVADARQGMLCAWLSAALLVGLLLNTTLGWAWADPTAALIIAAVAAKEGRDALTGTSCCAVAPRPVSGTESPDAPTCSCC